MKLPSLDGLIVHCDYGVVGLIVIRSLENWVDFCARSGSRGSINPGEHVMLRCENIMTIVVTIGLWRK